MGLIAKLISTVRCVSLVSGICNVTLVLLGLLILLFPASIGCNASRGVAVGAVIIGALVRICVLKSIASVQNSIALSIVGNDEHDLSLSPTSDSMLDHAIRTRYKRWLWWTRLSVAVTVAQFVIAVFLLLVVVDDLTSDASRGSCFSGNSWRHGSIIAILIITWVVVIMQCISGSEVLRWRSFYASHDAAWRAHYREVFDRGIREVLCCLGRIKYMSELEDDEVYMVARLLSDLMAYRASGTGHLELLAGLALLQKHKPTSVSYDYHVEAPYKRMKEASFFHQFAEAAYTGPLLDLGRHPLSFPCVWIYRQGTFSPWTRNRRPSLEGDNCWRGHAAAFLNYVKLPPDALRKGRVRQTKREAAYFVVVLHDLKTVVIAVRGTETPEDLITDGLCRECALTTDDLDGLINSNKLDPSIKEKLLSSFPCFGHSGIVESARELYRQIDGKPSDSDISDPGNQECLSSLLNEGCECHGYRIRIVGHSLGGSVAAVLGIMLYGRYPKLHVYAYGPLPCVDPILADACSRFVTSIVYNDEFSARLSMNSIVRLRASAMRALSNDNANPSPLPNLIKRISHIQNNNTNRENPLSVAPVTFASSVTVSETNNVRHHLAHTLRGGVFLCGHAMSCVMHSDSNQRRNSNIDDISADGFTESNSGQIAVSMDRLGEETQETQSSNYSAEMFLPGVIVHLVRRKRGEYTNPIVGILRTNEDKRVEYKAFVVNRDEFVDVVVSPYMFLDHLPWRCQYALRKVLESQKERSELFAEEADV